MSEDAPDLVEVLASFTNFVQNERVRCYNEGIDKGTALERLRCAQIAANEIAPSDYVSQAATIRDYILSGGTPDNQQPSTLSEGEKP